jgi:outer membrane receptor protein involved in Fe transport
MRSLYYFSALLLLSLAASIAGAQNLGALRLQVKDPSGAGLHVTGILSGPHTLQQFSTDSTGLRDFSNLSFGNYKLQLYRNGFVTDSRMIEISTSAPLSLSVTLTLSSIISSVTIFSETPIGRADLPIDQIPVPVQGVTAQQIQDSNALDIADTLNKRINGVYINENQDNPFQPDVNYRGYTASPLLGTPQGLSVYLDGVRQNQPFGDVVSWDLIPTIAVQDIELIPGANPVYGLNSLGGALVLRTKDGITNSGVSVQATGGSYGRRAIQGEYGGSNQHGLNWFMAGNLYHEDGWREFSPSSVRQSFAKLGYIFGKTTFALTGTYSQNNLTGNGTQDFRALARNYSSVYTIPDTTWNHNPSLTLNATHQSSDHLTLSGNVYFRYIRANTTNGDINDDSFDQSLYTLSAADIAALNAAGYTGFPTTGNSTTEPYPFWRCIAQGLEKDEPGEKCTGITTNTVNKQHNYGLSGLVSYRTARNRIAFGAAWDRSSLTYQQVSQLGYLNPDGKTVTNIPVFTDGSTNVDGVPLDTRVNLHGSTNTPGFYATDTLTLSEWTITASGRYNHANVNNVDRLPSSRARGTLTAVNNFQRFNPAIGFTYNPGHRYTIYGDYSESNRAPTSIELGCADPDFPCNLPNALVSDPPLRQVVSRTVEVGIRSRNEGLFQWSTGFFRGQNSNDLLFIASDQTGFGYFTNFGKTIRKGVEASFDYRLHHVDLGIDYTFLAATYGSAGEVDGSSNSSNEAANDGLKGLEGNITISPGNRLPQTPQHIFKFNADYTPMKKAVVTFNITSASGTFARGNENNQDRPDGTYYLGGGSTDAYAIANLGGRYQFTSHVQFFVQMNNLFNSRYATASQLGATPYDANGVFTPRPLPPVRVGGETQYPLRNTTFLAPGAPFTVFGGLRFIFRL